MNSKSYQFSRQQLYDLVWSSPMLSVAKTVGLSDVGLAKACKKADIPIPPRGYWAKLKAGKNVVRLDLPKRGFGKADSINIGNKYGHWRSEVDLDAELPSPPLFLETIQEVIARAQSAVARITFSKKLSDAHQLIATVLNEDERRRKQLLSEQFYWKKPIFDAPEAKRKLRILNAIFFVMTRVGEKPSLKYAEPIEANVIVGDTPISLVIEAITESKKSKVNEKQHRAKAALQLRIEIHGVIEEIQTVWQDADETTIEDQIRQISAGLLIAGEFQYRAQELHSYKWLIERKSDHEEKKRKERERIERERLEKQIQLEQDKRRQLFAEVSGWRKADEIRLFVAVINEREELKQDNDSAEKLAQWSAWALAEADRLDPMKRSVDELVDNILGKVFDS